MRVRCLVRVLFAVVLCSLPAPCPCSRTPSCRFRSVTSAAWQPCRHFKYSNYCCSGAVHFEKELIQARSTLNPPQQQEPRQTANVSFTATSDVGTSFLVRRARGCSGPSECLDLDVAVVDVVEVQLSFVPVDGDLAVTRLDYAEFQDWLSHTTTDASTETRFLHNSSLIFDIKGQDAELRVHSPDSADGRGQGGPPARFLTACLSLASDSASFSCSGCDCSPASNHTRTLCFNKPYGGNVMRVENVTGFHNGTHLARYFGAVLQVGNACLRARQHVPLRAAGGGADAGLSEEGGVNTAALGASLAVVVALSALLCLLLQRRAARSRRSRLPEEGEEAAAIAGLHAGLPERSGPFRAVVLYRQERDPERAPYLKQIVRLLQQIIAHDGRAEVLDPYEDPVLLEEGVAAAARLLLAQDDVRVIMVASEGAWEEGREQRGVHDAFFEAAKRHVESYPDSYGKGRILTLTMSAERIDWPWAERVYFLPERITKLLSDIPGAPAANTPEISYFLRLLRENIEIYTCQKNQECRLLDSRSKLGHTIIFTGQ